MDSTDKQDNPKELDLDQLIREFALQKKEIFLITLFCVLVGSLFYLSNSNFYKSEALVYVVQEDESSLTAVTSQYTSIAGLAGIDLGGSGENRLAIAEKTLLSRDFFTHLYKKDKFLVHLLAVTGENLNGEFIIDQDSYSAELGEWVRNVKSPLTPKPGIVEAYEYFHDNVFSLDTDQFNGFISLYVRHPSPSISKEILETTVDYINEISAERDNRVTNLEIDYLNKLLLSNPSKDMNSFVSQLMQSKLQKLMMTNLNEEYLLRYIDKPYIPIEKDFPSLPILVLFSLASGLILSLFIVYVLSAFETRISFKVNNIKSLFLIKKT